jgi:hypothetical protein
MYEYIRYDDDVECWKQPGLITVAWDEDGNLELIELSYGMLLLE